MARCVKEYFKVDIHNYSCKYINVCSQTIGAPALIVAYYITVRKTNVFITIAACSGLLL